MDACNSKNLFRWLNCDAFSVAERSWRDAVDELVMVVESAEQDGESLAVHAERGAWSDALNGEFKLTLPLGETRKRSVAALHACDCSAIPSGRIYTKANQRLET